ncbi:MAG: methyltransferase, partial [Oceanospirillaceae bacterium]|nr:methyltransferase [Oceanospirillaceae bacterium]
LKEWKTLLEDGGVLVFSDLVWFTNSPSEEVAAYWEKAYPEMATVDERVKQSETEGYEVVESFTLNEEAWSAYFEPLQARVHSVKGEMIGSPALKDIEEELAICRQYPDEFGYQMFVLRRV